MTYRRFSLNFEKVPALTDFAEGDNIVDPKHFFMGRIIAGGLARLPEGKVRIRNAISKKNKYLFSRDCLYVPEIRSRWRLKEKNNRSWWVTCKTDMDQVVLRAIKVYNTEKVKVKKIREDKLNNLAYVFVL